MSLGQSLDTSLNSGEEIRFKQKYQQLMQRLAKKTHMTYSEIERLAIVYYKMQKNSDGKNIPVLRSHIKDVLHIAFDMTNNEIIPYILSYHDKSLTPRMSLESWIKMISLYLRGTFEEKIHYCYSVYKSTGVSDKLIRSNLVNLLKKCLWKDNNEYDEEAVKDMVDMLIKRMDWDRDGKLSFDDFRTTVLERPDFLEVFGALLPSRLAVYGFRHTVIDKFRKK